VLDMVFWGVFCRQVCKEMVKMHRIPLPIDRSASPCTFSQMRKFLSLAFPDSKEAEKLVALL